MKNQLLEDFGDSRSQPAVPAPVKTVPAAAPTQPAPVRAVTPEPQAAVAESDARPRVWRARAASVERALPPAPRAVWRQREAASTPPGPGPEPAVQEAQAPPQAAPAPVAPPPTFVPSFSSRAPDPLLRVPVAQPSAGERGARPLLGWGAGLALVVMVLGAGAWAYRDSQDVASLAVVAGEAKPAIKFAPYVAPAPEAALPLVLAKPDSAAAQPAPEMDDSRQVEVRVQEAGDEPEQGEQDAVAQAAVPVAAAAAVAAAQAPKAAPKQPARKEPAAKQADAQEKARVAEARGQDARKQEARKQEARKLAARQAKTAKPASTKPGAAKAANKAEARKSEPRKTAAAGAPAAKPAGAGAEPEFSQAETLRQCRAAGYHATKCMQRGCVATKFGLACRG